MFWRLILPAALLVTLNLHIPLEKIFKLFVLIRLEFVQILIHEIAYIVLIVYNRLFVGYDMLI